MKAINIWAVTALVIVVAAGLAHYISYAEARLCAWIAIVLWAAITAAKYLCYPKKRLTIKGRDLVEAPRNIGEKLFDLGFGAFYALVAFGFFYLVGLLSEWLTMEKAAFFEVTALKGFVFSLLIFVFLGYIAYTVDYTKKKDKNIVLAVVDWLVVLLTFGALIYGLYVRFA